MVQHALDAADKAMRRTSILAAARQLFLAEPEKLPSAARIATAAGLAKGTVYLYFRTKEEIFMALLDEERGQVLNLVRRAFAHSSANAAERIEQFVADYIAHLHSHPQLLQLEAQGYSVLERNMDIERLRTFKRASISDLNSAGDLIDQALSLTSGQGTRLLIHTHAMSLGLWQALDIPEPCRQWLQDPAMAAFQLDFHHELREVLGRYWRLG